MATCDSRRGERGFTLAGLIVILTIIAIFLAYTVPTQWSKILQRDRERQTYFVMRQYARAIHEWQAHHGGGFPTSLDQMKEAKLPRIIRGPDGQPVDPLTGKLDWILIPPGAYTQGQPVPPPTTGTTGTTSTTGTTGTTTTTGTTGTTSTAPGGGTFNAAASPKDYKGPF